MNIVMSERPIRSVSHVLDTLVNLLKWPIAVSALLLLPGCVVAVIRLARTIGHHPASMVWFGVGAGGYWLAWRLILHRPLLGSLLPTLEHELTHALFALLTFHPITAIKASWRGDGVMRYVGEGNWLITIAPYFFPTLSVVLMLLLGLVPETWRQTTSVLLGVTVAYHFISTWRETHMGQPDLQKVGFPFAIALLPSANLASLGAVLAFAYRGFGGVATFGTDIAQFTVRMIQWF
jgi:Peptidase M50B-like